MATNPAISCAVLRTEHGQTTSGLYFLDPDNSGVSFRTTCNMAYDGGGWSLLMRINGGRRDHVDNNGYSCTAADLTPSTSFCKLATVTISRFFSAPGVQVTMILPDSGGFIPWFQRAASDADQWPTNLDCSNRIALNGNPVWRWYI